jgi:hypothetical protein
VMGRRRLIDGCGMEGWLVSFAIAFPHKLVSFFVATAMEELGCEV